MTRHDFYTELELKAVQAGDILFFVRPEPPGKPEHVAGLHWLIHVLDGTPFTHVAVVTKVTAEVITIAHSDGSRVRHQALSELHDEYGGAPMFVSHPDPEAFEAVAGAATDLVTGAEETAQADYPHFDLLLAAVVLRARDAGISESVEMTLAHLLSRAITASDDAPGRRMCAAFATEALAAGCKDKTALDLDDKAAGLLEGLYSDEEFWKKVGAGWVTATSESEGLLIDESSVEHVEKVFTEAVRKLRAHLSQLMDEGDLAALLYFGALLAVAPRSDEELGKRIATLSASESSDGWTSLVQTFSAAAAVADTLSRVSSLTSRFRTASRLVAWSGLTPMGHVRGWNTAAK